MLSALILVPAVLSLVAGGLLLKAGRDLDRTRSGESRAKPGPVASLVDDGLQRTRQAVDVLIQPDVHPDEVRPTAGAMRNRGQTYQVVGAGLVGVGLLMVLGILLLAA